MATPLNPLSTASIQTQTSYVMSGEPDVTDAHDIDPLEQSAVAVPAKFGSAELLIDESFFCPIGPIDHKL